MIVHTDDPGTIHVAEKLDVKVKCVIDGTVRIVCRASRAFQFAHYEQQKVDEGDFVIFTEDDDSAEGYGLQISKPSDFRKFTAQL